MGMLIKWLKGDPNRYVELSETNPLPVTPGSIALQKSIDQKYYVGQTEDLTFISPNHAYAELFNPVGSGVNVHVNVWTFSNITVAVTSFLAKFYLDGEHAGALTVSTKIASANRAVVSTPNAQIRFIANTASEPIAGIEGFTRRISGRETIVDVEEGKFIVPPGKAFSVFLTFPSDTSTARIAFGWWETAI